MLIDGKRALAYIVQIDDIQPIEGYDRVEYARTSGWWVVVSKNDNLSVGDKCVYFEIDSKVNAEDPRFAFLESKKYHVKTQKMCKVYSQGLLMPLSLFPELKDAQLGQDVTEELKVTYYEPEDNIRKSGKVIGQANKYKAMCSRHYKLARTKWWAFLYKRRAGRAILFFFFGKKRDKPKNFPAFVKKTDEERCENMPWILTNPDPWIATEKLDGTSCTYAMKREKRNKFIFYVCSRNRILNDENAKTYHDHNIYWDMAFKYHIQEFLVKFLQERKDCKWVYIQGEGVGSVQGNPLKLKQDDLYLFNFVTDVDGRWASSSGAEYVALFGMNWVPILGTVTMPDSMEELKLWADGMSAINKNVRREGIVYRSIDGQQSFKNVSREYLEKKKG